MCRGVFAEIPPRYEDCFVSKDDIRDKRGVAVKDGHGRIL
jgi:hypothetical protein